MNRLLTMEEVARLVGIAQPGDSRPAKARARLARRWLRVIGEERGTTVQVFRTGRHWMTTLEDVHRLLPELLAHDLADADALLEQHRRHAAELDALRRRVEILENRRLAPGKA